MQVGSKSTPRFAYALIVDSREVADTERLQRGLSACGIYVLMDPLNTENITNTTRVGVLKLSLRNLGQGEGITPEMSSPNLIIDKVPLIAMHLV